MTSLFSINVVNVSSGCIVQPIYKESTGNVIPFWARSAFGPALQKPLPSVVYLLLCDVPFVGRIQLVNPE